MKTIVSLFTQEAHSAFSSNEKETHTHTIKRMRGVVCSTKREAEEGVVELRREGSSVSNLPSHCRKAKCEISP